MHYVLITLCSSSQLKHLSTASAKALYLIEWVKFQVGTFWMLRKQERMKFLISVKYTFDIITWKLISVMQTSRKKKGKKYFKYLRVDIFCCFIWFQAWLFLLLLDNITLKGYKNMIFVSKDIKRFRCNQHETVNNSSREPCAWVNPCPTGLSWLQFLLEKEVNFFQPSGLPHKHRVYLQNLL